MPLGEPVRVAAVLAAYNRKALTLGCVRNLHRQQVDGVALDVFLLDDASTDGTAQAIACEFPTVTLLHGDGELYWGGGMYCAFGAAIAGDYDYYLWMNDDTHLDDGALALLLETERQLRRDGHPPAIVGGSTRHPDTGTLTYGGLVAPSRWRPVRFELIPPGTDPKPCDTMHGNAVLIPREVVKRIGNIDPLFIHVGGDGDYGLRARRAGCTVWIAPGTVATCAGNPPPRTGDQPLWAEYRRLWSTKTLPGKPWAVYTRRWAGILWPLVWLSPYLKGIVRLTLQRTRARVPERS